MAKLKEFTEEQGKDLTNFIEQQGLSRIKAGTMISEGDFYAGAASAIQFMFEGEGAENLTRIIPPMWILGIFSNRSPSTRWEEYEETRKRLDNKIMRSEILGRNGELMYEFIKNVTKYRKMYNVSGYTPSQILISLRDNARSILEDIGLLYYETEEEE
jgi:hypothetical protein